MAAPASRRAASLRASAASAIAAATAWWNEPAHCPDDDEWERVRQQAQRLDNCMAGVSAVLGGVAFCFLLVPTIVAFINGTPG